MCSSITVSLLPEVYTVSKLIQDKIKELEKQNYLLASNLVDAIWVMDAKTLTYEYITASIYEISGYTPEELINTSIADRLTPVSLKHATEVLSKEMRDYDRGKRVMQSLELELVHKQGDTYWVEIKAKFLKESDSPLKIVGITRDITIQKRAELQQKILNKKLVEALAEKEKLLKEIKVLRELLPICSGCKRIRNDDGKWWPLEAYVREHTDSEFTHTLCPDCKDVMYPDLKK
jgi:PAS domain S-box-containing protein